MIGSPTPVLFRRARSLILLGALSASIAGVAHAGEDRLPQPSCTNADLKGSYGFTARGTTLAGSLLPAPLQGPFTSGGVSTFDGEGNVTLTATSSFNGVIQGPVVIHGTYAVNQDCTYTSRVENGVTFRAVIADGGRELMILQTTPGVVISGIAEQQASPRRRDGAATRRPLQCSNETIDAAYGFLAEGVAGPPTLPQAAAGPLAGVGTVSFNPKGTFELVATRSVNGAIDAQPLSLSGTYSVNADCTFKMSFDVGFTFNATITAGGKEILFVETDPGAAIVVKAQRLYSSPPLR